MPSPVWFADLREKPPGVATTDLVRTLCDAAGTAGCCAEEDLVAIKVHFGERGNETFVSPVFVREVVRLIREAGGRPYLTDTNTLYKGSRQNAVEHLETAIEHGFSYATTGAPIIIADGLDGRNEVVVPVAGTHFDHVRIAGDIFDADAMVVVSHFKGHIIAGFGGAIKNLAMGAATPAGKKEQHNALLPQVNRDRCTACMMCQAVCPVGAVAIHDAKATINEEICLACGQCMETCPSEAIYLNYATGVVPFTERLAEYAAGAVVGKQGKAAYLTFVTHVTPFCDCAGWSDAPIVRDIGILAGADPVAIDAAAYDLVNGETGLAGTMLGTHHAPGKDKFAGLFPETRGPFQLTHAQKIGLGTREYLLHPVRPWE